MGSAHINIDICPQSGCTSCIGYRLTDYTWRDCGCTSCIGPRHTDLTDFNGCHGLIRTLILELAAGFWHLATGSRWVLC